MGVGRPGSGVEPLKTCIRVKFTWSGKRRVETLKLKPTAQNIRAAERLMAQVKQEIAAGVFDYGRHFPNSADAAAGSKSFQHYADLYLAGAAIASSTVATYKTPVTRWKRLFGEQLIPEIKRSAVRTAVSDVAKTVAGSTLNSYVSVLRGIFELAVDDHIIADNPTDKIKSAKHQVPPPDPLALDEMEHMITWMWERQPRLVAGFYEFAMLTGMRPSEMIALRWSKVDWRLNTVTIDTAHVRRRDKVTKTNRSRDIDISVRAKAVLAQLHTAKLGDHVFLNPRTMKPWRDNEEQRVFYWLPALKALGLRPRDAYQTRHTYATVLLMAGINIGYIAKQLGHSSIAMTIKHYARWVDIADKGRQAQLVNDLFDHAVSTARPAALNLQEI